MKKYFTVIILVLLTFSLTSCADIKNYLSPKVEKEIPVGYFEMVLSQGSDPSFNRDQLDILRDLGYTASLEVSEDGMSTLNYFGQVDEFMWGNLAMFTPRPADYTYDGTTLLIFDDTNNQIVYEKREKPEPEEDEPIKPTLYDEYPQYFDLDTENGLTLYVWKDDHNNIHTTLVPKTEEELTDSKDLEGIEVDAMAQILSEYDRDIINLVTVPTIVPSNDPEVEPTSIEITEADMEKIKPILLPETPEPDDPSDDKADTPSDTDVSIEMDREGTYKMTETIRGDFAYEFNDGIKLVIPRNWKNLYDVEINDNEITFYHRSSRVWAEVTGTNVSGMLFKIFYSDEEIPLVEKDEETGVETKLTDRDLVRVKSAEGTFRYIEFFGEENGYKDNERCWNEWTVLHNSFNYIKNHSVFE